MRSNWVRHIYLNIKVCEALSLPPPCNFHVSPCYCGLKVFGKFKENRENNVKRSSIRARYLIDI